MLRNRFRRQRVPASARRGMDSAAVPESFKSFLLGIGSSLEFYNHSIARFIRFKPHKDLNIRIEATLKELPLEKVEWLPGFYSIPSSLKLSNTNAYINAWIYGMDASSALAINALEINENDQVLDICCAPGTKLTYICDLLGRYGTGIVTGVDLSKNRLAICKGLVRKYSHNRMRLFEFDGTLFDVRPPTRVGGKILDNFYILKNIDEVSDMDAESLSVASEDVESTPANLTMPIDGKVSNESVINIGEQESIIERCGLTHIELTNAFVKPYHSSKLVRNDDQSSNTMYDKVIVDSECTHDGSVAHIEKYIKNGWDKFDDQFLNPERLSSLETLQRSLLMNGKDNH